MKDYTHPPLSVELTWPTPNYVDPVTRGPGLLILGIVLTSLASVTVCARIWSRAVITRTFGVDDWLIISALLFAIPTTALAIWESNLGVGHHVWDLHAEWIVPLNKIAWASQWTYTFSSLSVKLSVLMFYRRLQRGAYTTTFLWATRIGLAYNAALAILVPLCLILSCLPIESIWKQYDPTWLATHKYKCGREDIWLPVSSIISVIGDIYATIIPLILVNGLHMPTRQKWSLYSLFGVSFIVIAAGIIRPVISWRVVNTYDSSWQIWILWIWTLIELQLAIVVASIPALKPFFVKYVSNSSLGDYPQGYTSGTAGTRKHPSRLSKHLGNGHSAAQLSHGSAIGLNTMLSERKWRNEGYEDVERQYGNSTKIHNVEEEDDGFEMVGRNVPVSGKHSRDLSHTANNTGKGLGSGAVVFPKGFEGIVHTTDFRVESTAIDSSPPQYQSPGRIRVREINIPEGNRTVIEAANSHHQHSNSAIGAAESDGQQQQSYPTVMVTPPRRERSSGRSSRSSSEDEITREDSRQTSTRGGVGEGGFVKPTSVM